MAVHLRWERHKRGPRRSGGPTHATPPPLMGTLAAAVGLTSAVIALGWCTRPPRPYTGALALFLAATAAYLLSTAIP